MTVPTAEVREWPGMPGRDVVVCADADDAGMVAVAYALLSPVLDVRGLVLPEGGGFLELVRLLGPAGDVPVLDAAGLAEVARAGSDALFVVALGSADPLAAAVAAEPSALRLRGVVVGPDVAGPVLSGLDAWLVPPDVSDGLGRFAQYVGEKLAAYGDLGRYLAPRVTAASVPAIAAVGLVVNPTAAIWQRERTSDEFAELRTAVRLDEMWLAVDFTAKVARSQD